MMTRKDYKLIAEVLRRVGNHPIKDVAVEYFVMALEEDNPRFKPDIFRKAST